MKLIDDLFEVISYQGNDSTINACIRLNPGHIIYAGHFPGHPVTPGVIQLQIVHELVEKNFGRKIRLSTMEQCKFLKILNPVEFSELDIQISFTIIGEMLNVVARGEKGGEVFFKLQAVYIFL